MNNTPLSKAAIKEIVDGMPDALNKLNNCKAIRFDRKIKTTQQTMPTPPTIKAGQRLLIRHPKLGLREAKVLETNGDYAKILHEGDSLGGWMAINWLLSELVSILPDQRQSMADAVREANHADALQRLIQLGDLEMSPEGRALYERDRDEAKKNFLYGPRHSTYKKDQDNITRKVRFAYEGIEELPTYTTNTSK